VEVGITGVTLSANMGGQSMLLSTLENLPKIVGHDLKFQLFSVYPKQDQELQNLGRESFSIHPVNPITLLLLYFPLAILAYPFGAVGKSLLKWIPFFRKISRLKFVVDLAGIAFVDGRGLPLLAYNAAIVLPFLVMGVPVMKLSQALGPFQARLNRTIAGWVLARCSLVVARGKRSAEHLRELGLPNAFQLSDTAFAMSVSNADSVEAERILQKLRLNQPFVILSPSRVVERLVGETRYHAEMKSVVAGLLNKGHSVLILAHSLGRGSSKNNDTVVCEQLAAAVQGDSRVHLIGDLENARVLRAIIGRAHLFLGCRFHSIVSSLIMGVPTIVIGWSHKYAEMVEQFGVSLPVFSYTNWNADKIMMAFSQLERDHAEISEKLAIARVPVLQSSRRNFIELSNKLRKDGS